MNTENNKRYDIKKIRTFLIEKRFGFCHAWWGIPAPNPAMNEYDKLEVDLSPILCKLQKPV